MTAAQDEAGRRDALLDAVKRARDGQGRGAARSWHLMIGSPGAGKTAALRNAGLQYLPTAEQTGRPESDVAPTQGFDCWLAEDAMLIDSAGRFSTQPDGGDASEWRNFLSLLKANRPHFALNSVVIVLALDDFARAAPEERLTWARTIRRRLREIDDALALRLPAYLVIAKADHLAGFAAFFADLTPEDRAQVWGVTLPPPENGVEKADLAQNLAAGLDRLRERLDAGLLARLQSGSDPLLRSQIFTFPRQFVELAGLLRPMIDELAASSRLDPPPRLRGLYFTAARRQGPAADFVAEDIRGRFGLDPPTLDAGPSSAGGFFLDRLFTDVIFREENLVTIDPRDRSGRRRLRQLAAGLVAAVVVALAAFWLLAAIHQQRLVAQAEARLAGYAAAARDIPTRDIADSDFARVVEALDLARSATIAPADRWPGALAFDQTDKVLGGAGDLYQRGLNLLLLPRMLVGLGQTMQAPQRGPVAANDARLYLMLGGKAPLDPNFALAASTSLFERLAPGADRQKLRQSLTAHAAALFAKPLTPIALDDVVAEDAALKASGAETP